MEKQIGRVRREEKGRERLRGGWIYRKEGKGRMRRRDDE